MYNTDTDTNTNGQANDDVNKQFWLLRQFMRQNDVPSSLRILQLYEEFTRLAETRLAQIHSSTST